METAAQQLKPEGYFKEDVGAFWEILETRPYMRVCYTYFDALISCGMMHRAIDEGQRLLELCENDNLGVRYQLMHLYATWKMRCTRWRCISSLTPMRKHRCCFRWQSCIIS